MQKSDGIFVANKPIFISSNNFLKTIKKELGIKKCGFSGTLDPFAKGSLIIAFGSYTKLFRFLDKKKKRYKATIWFGAKSETLDIEGVTSIEDVRRFSIDNINQALNSLLGSISYYPPKYCAKKVDGIRAYRLARDKKEPNLDKITSNIYSIKLINYSHPFLTFEIESQEGTYIRSLADIVCKKLDTFGSLSYLYRICEGKFEYENRKLIKNIVDYISLQYNYYLKDENDILKGKPLSIEDFEVKKDGSYVVLLREHFSVISIDKKRVGYLLNRVKLC